MISQLERAAGIAPNDLAEAKLDKLEKVLRRSFPTIAHVAPLFATLLSLPFEGRYAALSLTPREQKERTLVALNELWAASPSTAPYVHPGRCTLD